MDYTTYDSGYGAATAIFYLFYFVFAVAFYVFYSYTLSKIFQKAGVEGWKAWVPILNSWTLLELGGYAGFWALLALVPFVNIVSVVFLVLAVHNVNKGFGKDGAFTVLYVFLPYVWSGILAWGSAQYNPALTVPRYNSGAVQQYQQPYAAHPPQHYGAPQQPAYGQNPYGAPVQPQPYAAPQNPYGAPQPPAPPVSNAPQQPYGAPQPPTNYPAPPAPPAPPTK